MHYINHIAIAKALLRKGWGWEWGWVGGGGAPMSLVSTVLCVANLKDLHINHFVIFLRYILILQYVEV